MVDLHFYKIVNKVSMSFMYQCTYIMYAPNATAILSTSGCDKHYEQAAIIDESIRNSDLVFKQISFVHIITVP